MKKTAAFILIIAISLVFCSCGAITAPKDVNERVYSRFSGMKSYCAQVKISTSSNKNKNTYDAVQYFKFPDKMRTEASDIVTVINGQTAVLTNLSGENVVKISQTPENSKDFMFLHTFFDAYYNGTSAESYLSGDDGSTVVLSVKTGIDNPYRQQAELTLDSKSLQPLFLELKTDGDVSLRIDYIDFKLNNEPDDSLFEIQIKEALKCTNILTEHGRKSTLTPYVII